MKLDFHHGLKLQKNLYLEIVRLFQELLQADSKNELILSLASSKREKKL